MEGFQGKMKLPIFGLFSNWEREFHPKILPLFWNSRIQEYFRTAGIIKREFHYSPWNCLFLRSWVDFKESYRLKRSPRLFQFQKSGLFQNRGNLNLAGFQGKMKLPIFGLFSNWEREFHPKFHSYFWNSRIQEYSRTAGISSRGSFITLLENVCSQRAESLSSRVTVWWIPAVISIPKIRTILKSREFEFGGVSLLSKNTPDFWSSAKLSPIQTAGILK